MAAIALKEVKSVMRNPYIIPSLIGLHLVQLLVLINVYNNFVGQNDSGGEAYAVIEIIGGGKETSTVVFYASTVLTQLIIMATIAAAALITSSWENKTIYRIFISTKNKWEVYLGFLLGYMTDMLIISAIFMVLAAFVLDFNWGNAFGGILGITLALIFVCASFAIFISSALKETKLVTAVLSFSILAMTFVSGGIFTGAVFGSVNKFTLNKLAFDAFIGVIEGKSPASFSKNIVIMLSAGLIFSAASIFMLKKGESDE